MSRTTIDILKATRRTLQVAALVVIASLGVLSIVGARLGAGAARLLFNSIPMAAFWVALAALLVAGFLVFRGLRSRLWTPRGLGLAAVHAGCVLILIGGMVGSDAGHRLAGWLLGSEKIRSGYMTIDEGTATPVVHDGQDELLGRLPFAVGLVDFQLEHYGPPCPWMLGVNAPSPIHGRPPRQQEIDWAVGKEVPIPFTDARVKVLTYMPGARPAYAEGAGPTIRITDAAGNAHSLPAEAGREIALTEPAGVLRVVQVFTCLAVRGGKAVDIPGPDANPAVKVEFKAADGEVKDRFVFPGGRDVHHASDDPVRLEYVVPEPIGAAPDDSTGAAAMEVLVTRGDKSMRTWLIAPTRKARAVVALTPVVDPVGHDGHVHGEVRLVLVPPQPGPIRDYKSRLAVLDREGVVLEKTIEVNHPLHYRGYHFYQSGYDDREGLYTVLAVRSDSGLIPAYAGFALLCGGAFVLMWLRPGEPGAVTNGRAAYRLVILGFPLLTLGLILGAVWGKIAWGDWWNWDPKELWSLVSWLVFAGYLHLRYLRGGRDTKASAAVVVTGMAAVVITLLWVNLGSAFVSRLHSYSSVGAVLAIKHTPAGLLALAAMLLQGVAGAMLLVPRRRAAGMIVFGAGFGAALAAFVARWIEVDHLPMQSMFEIFLCLGVLALPLAVFCRAFLKVGGEAGDALLGAVVLFPAALVFSADPQHLPPALQHWLFAPHVAAYLIAYMILAKAAIQAAAGLVKDAWGASRV